MTRTDIKRAFNQCSLNHKPLEFEQFYKAILRVGVELNNQKIKDLKKRLKMLPVKADKKKRKSPKSRTTIRKGGNSGSEEDSEGEESENEGKQKLHQPYNILFNFIRN